MQKWVRNQCGRRRTDDLLYQTPQDNKHPLLHHNIHQLMTAAQRGGGRESVNVK
ncbi:hypothetical protein N8772_02940 [Rickettsiales bacterium]|nr:hypothetical protein [Rickettsiales bacterium]MDB2550282.1 hypothetical protein [Rickettsiales bacterium]